MNNHRVLLFESFNNDRVEGLLDDLESEVSSSRMRVGPSMDKLPWAMEVVVYSFLKDRVMEASSSERTVSIEDVVKKLEDSKEQLCKQAVDLLVSAGMGEDDIRDTFETGYKVVKLKNYNLTSRHVDGKRGIQKDIEGGQEDSNLESTFSPNEEQLDKQFRSARNKGRNMMRKHLSPETYRTHKEPKKKHEKFPKLKVRKISSSSNNLV